MPIFYLLIPGKIFEIFFKINYQLKYWQKINSKFWQKKLFADKITSPRQKKLFTDKKNKSMTKKINRWQKNLIDDRIIFLDWQNKFFPMTKIK
jgi:hypothetical protein